MAPRKSDINVHGVNLTPLKRAQRAYVQEVCDRLGTDPTGLARRAGVDPSTLTRFMNSPEYKHSLSSTTLSKIEAVAGFGMGALPPVTSVPRVRVWGDVAAGIWKDVAIIEGAYLDDIPVVENRRYVGISQYGLLVRDASVNRRIPEGSYAICVAWEELGGDLENGQYVHIERRRGDLRETTIKRVRVVEGRIELHADSDDPRFQETLDPEHPGPGVEVDIKGLVVGSFSHFD